MSFADAPFTVLGDILLEWIIRGVGGLWLAGAVMLYVSLRREATLDGMIARLDSMAADVDAQPSESSDDTYGDIDAPVVRPPKSDAQKQAQAWEDRDDRARRRALAAQGLLLAATGLSMLMMHILSAWLCAFLVAAQGGYFLWRERTARGAPTPETADGARPNASTINAGWFSLAAGSLVWVAAARGLFG